ncbi:uncharacterized protein LOC129232052, partial [Uloborus diversus]|uniref:uncharacterized protein LOC129232052 n=1 Tax=Uloborus diversus TaxID=327109 RepID=UPI0024098278
GRRVQVNSNLLEQNPCLPTTLNPVQRTLSRQLPNLVQRTLADQRSNLKLLTLASQQPNLVQRTLAGQQPNLVQRTLAGQQLNLKLRTLARQQPNLVLESRQLCQVTKTQSTQFAPLMSVAVFSGTTRQEPSLASFSNIVTVQRAQSADNLANTSLNTSSTTSASASLKTPLQECYRC